MKKTSLLLAFLLPGFFALFGQQYIPDESIQKEVNEQLWKPFKQAFENRDWQSFNNLHTDDVLRINQWNGIKLGEEYKKSNEKSFQQNPEVAITIDFRFEHRIHRDSLGYEVGYYKVTYKSPDQELQTSYARFHVKLKKVDDLWKIAQDWDTGEVNGTKIGKEDYENSKLTDLE